MYAIFFHLSGLAVIEIIFYFYYIGPMEIKLFHDLLYKSVDSNHDIYNNYNISFLNDNINTVSQDLYKLSKEKQSLRNDHNEKLFILSIYGLTIIIGVSFFILIIELLYKYYIFKNGSISFPQFELTNIVSRSNLHRVESLENARQQPSPINISIESLSTNSDQFISFDKIKKKIFKNFIHWILLGGLIVGFEFWFFNKIVINYRIISREELQYIIFEKIISEQSF